MNDFLFYTDLGLEHVLDINAYDHILFLCALAIPFSFRQWRQVLILASIFTLAHCLSLAIATYQIIKVPSELIEFLIPFTIALTALYNLYSLKTNRPSNLFLHAAATAIFGLVHGFGFSNYFTLIIADAPKKLLPLVAFALGIELSQVIIVLSLLLLAYLLTEVIGIKKKTVTAVVSIIVLLITLPLLLKTFVW